MTPDQRGRREVKIIGAVPCPACPAERGEKCVYRTDAERATARGRMLVHGQRREAWQAWRRDTPLGFLQQSWGPGGSGGLLHPQSEEARAAALELSGAELAEGGKVTVPRLRDAIEALAQAGWRIE